MARSASAAPPPSAYQRALRRLARRDHSEDELRRALRTRGHTDEEIDQALIRLREQNYLDDDAFAERFARSRMTHRGHGRAKIRQGLKQRGLSRERMYVSLERNMKCAVGLCGHCQLGPTFVCKDGPVFEHARVEKLLSVREL